MNSQRTGLGVSLRMLRNVWAAVSRTPRASVRELAQVAGCSQSVAAAALRALVLAGYVTHAGSGTGRSRHVVVPLR
jgi:DNA-binding MarR family transcriptional regulator